MYNTFSRLLLGADKKKTYSLLMFRLECVFNVIKNSLDIFFIPINIRSVNNTHCSNIISSFMSFIQLKEINVSFFMLDLNNGIKFSKNKCVEKLAGEPITRFSTLGNESCLSANPCKDILCNSNVLTSG